MSNNETTLEDARNELLRQRDKIDRLLRELDRIGVHLFPPVNEIVVKVTAPDTDELTNLLTGEPIISGSEENVNHYSVYMVGPQKKIAKRGPLKGYQKAHKILDGMDVVGYIARVRHGRWDALDTSFEKLGWDSAKVGAMQIVADNDQKDAA